MESSTSHDDHNASRRARELYRYFQPERPVVVHNVNRADLGEGFLPPATARALDASIQATASSASLPPLLLQLSQPLATVNTPQPGASLLPETLVLGGYNATLTSFAQLVALRLNVDRVLISVSDRQSQFILAQATRLNEGCIPRDDEYTGDRVRDGYSNIPPTAWSMCEATLALPPSTRKPKNYSFLVVNDLQESELYKSVSFQADGPQYRFYVGTPLTTETKINIGCLSVLDTKPRTGFNDLEKETLGSLGMLIMDYLQVSRQASEGRRAARLSRGLSYFVEGSSSFVDCAHPSSTGGSVPAFSTPPSSQLRANHLSVGSCTSFDFPSRRSPSSDARSSSCASEYKADQGVSSMPGTPFPDWWSSRGKVLTLDESHGHSWAFRRAANLIRESLELDADGGVIFLEAGNSPLLDLETASDCSGETSNPAPVLAISTNDEPFAPEPGSTVLYPATNLDSGFLHQLLRRYDKGKLWSFHRDGVISNSDDERPQLTRSRNVKATDLPKTASKKWKSTENALLNLYFPNATQVLFVPLWNAANSQWFAGCLCWNTIETRVFSASVELSSLLGFGSSIMAECNRVESLISDRQKGDFIGSISHELRSPLHGILAAAEFLNGTNLDEFQGSLLETINACGRTLLDTMNQVLDFSKIVSLERTWRHMKRNKTPSGLKDMNDYAARLDTYVATDLAILAEEVVEGVCLGHMYGQKSMTSSDQPVLLPHTTATGSLPNQNTNHNSGTAVEVVIDIGQNDWVYQTQPGALRRIIMNVFGNAMKYTDAGRVSVQLEMAEASEGRHRQGAEGLVTLTVSDTGKGISEEFLRGRLYTPFAQEDTLAVGTGLGLSIVRSLVKSLNGTINIHSSPGKGTVVKVSLPLVRPESEDSPGAPLGERLHPPVLNECRTLRDSHEGRRVAILGVEPVDAAKHPFWSVISRYLTDWYGLQLVSWQPRTPIDILLTDEESLAMDSKRSFPATFPVLLILCNKSMGYNTKGSEWSSLATCVNIMRRPFGPHKLARSIRNCLDNLQAGTLASTQPFELPERPRLSNTTFSSGTSSYVDLDRSRSSSVAEPLSTTVSSPPLSPLPDFKPECDKPEERKPRVLVVDDNHINLSLMLTFLKKCKLPLLDSAENGKLAVDAVERMQQGYDLIFMDISMPVMNGFEATRAVRALERDRDGCGPATIIALTGLSSSRDESEALTSGVDLFLTKPVSFKEVSRLLDEWAENGLSHRSLSS